MDMQQDHDDKDWMRQALLLAEQAAARDEVPVGALVVRDQVILGQGFNCNLSEKDPTAHAEIVAIRDACRYFGNYRLPGTTLYATLEPCPMCFAAIVQARVDTLVFGAPDLKGGYRLFFQTDPDRFNHKVRVRSGVRLEECRDMVQAFFREKRERGKRKWLQS